MNWIILALVLVIPGAAGLGWGHLQKRSIETQTAEAIKAVSDAPSAEEYLAMYNQWFELTPAQKVENPWGQGQYGGPDIQKRLRQDQSLRFTADLPDLDTGLKSYPQQLADVLYGVGWDQHLAEFQQQRERRDLITTVSVISASAGVLIFCGGLIKCLLALLLKKKQGESSDLSQSVTVTQKNKSSAQPKAAAKEKKHKKDTPPVVDRPDTADAKKEHPASEDKPAHHRGYFESVTANEKRPKPATSSQTSPVSAAIAAAVSVLDPAPVSDGESYFGWAMEPEEENIAISTMMTTKPVVKHGLTELTEEVSAIRQYAVAQQDQMRKLQDGYDWVIIRRFCLRVIRCIDNLDDQMSRLEEKDQVLMTCMEDIRDELIFALESSGVEQFQPDLNTPFKGLEKYAEAIRQRIPAPDASQAGTIAEIIRPGYQYLISDDDVKIVRCAQVKLYDMAETEA